MNWIRIIGVVLGLVLCVGSWRWMKLSAAAVVSVSDEDRALAAQAVQAAQDGQRAIVDGLVAVMAAPKRIVRDSQGRPVGVETITTDETLVGCDDIITVLAAPKRIVWDSQGRPAGVETVLAE